MPNEKNVLTECGCNCKECYCTETACHSHHHCHGPKCNGTKLLDAILRDFRSFCSINFKSDRDIAIALIKVFGKW